MGPAMPGDVRGLDSGDGMPQPSGRGPDKSAGDQPPVLGVRVDGRAPRGLNKPAVLIAVGGGLAGILILGSNGISGDPSRMPSETRLPLSEPARPEAAEGSVRGLPATYAEDASIARSTFPATIPVLGPPLAGDMAMLANMDDPSFRPAGAKEETLDGSGHPAASAFQEKALEEADQALRSDIFFSLRSGSQETPGGQDASARANHPPTPFGALRAHTRISPAAGAQSLHPGAVLPASLVTAIDSEAPGPVIAQITQPVHDSLTGKTLLIPQGARLIGAYAPQARYGQSRVAIMWSRLIMPDGNEITLDEVAVSPSGSAGIDGDVDNHWADVFAGAALGTLINIGVATTQDPPSIGVTFGGVGIASNVDPAEAALQDGVQRSALIVTNRVVDRSLSIPPTIRVKAGARVSVLVTRRLRL